MGETPMTSIASSSSRILREPRSAQIADPAAPEISSATMIGLACWITASTLAPPVKDWAPSCWVREPTWRAMTAPNGMETRAAGRIVTLATNQNCSMNSRTWNGLRKIARATATARAKSFPVSRSGASSREGRRCPGAAGAVAPGTVAGGGFSGGSGGRTGIGAVTCAHLPRPGRSC